MRISSFLADRIASRPDLPLVKAIRLNRWVVSGCRLSPRELDQAARANLRNIAGSFYILFHNLNRPDALQTKVRFGPAAEELIAGSRQKRRGVVVAGLHLSNFDLVMQAAAWRGLVATALSLPEDSEHHQAVEWQHQFRRTAGLEILPASLPSFRLAIRRLQEGNTLLTGIDRPIPVAKYKPDFFGRPANLPTHYVTLALEASVPLILFAAIRQPDGIYHIHASEEIWMRSFTDRRKEVLFNAGRVLEIAADFIRLAPDQWSIFLPAWPDAIADLP